MVVWPAPLALEARVQQLPEAALRRRDHELLAVLEVPVRGAVREPGSPRDLAQADGRDPFLLGDRHRRLDEALSRLRTVVSVH